tara:strand:+ start:388 stop:627 length:240 start_codon:yes stop_codon:yes gene_type:complete
MSRETLEINKEEANLLRFYGGLEMVIHTIEGEIERVERNKIGDWKLILKKDKDHLKLMKRLNKKLIFLLYGDEEEKDNE